MSFDTYMKFSEEVDVKGEATATGYEQQIEIFSFSWGASNPVTVGPGKLAGALLSFYGQHEHRRLTIASAQLDLLDGFAGDPDFLWADDGVHAALRGTSQAAPHVSGAVALLFQLNQGLRTSQLRELLRTTTSGVPGYSPYSGFGKLAVSARSLCGLPPGSV